MYGQSIWGGDNLTELRAINRYLHNSLIERDPVKNTLSTSKTLGQTTDLLCNQN